MQATRATVGARFDEWAPAQDYPSCGTENCSDPSFFVHQDQERMIASVEPKPRTIWLCEALVCNPIAVNDGDGNPIELDIDGPSIAEQVPGLLLLLNAWVAVDTPQIAYLATPDANSLTSWTATELPTEGIDVNDPVISEDGKTIVFGNDNDDDLWVTGRQDVADPFGPPQHLASVNVPGALDVEPDLLAWSSGELELIFKSDRVTASVYQVYHAVCTR
jgi:hypothetical protein